MQYNITYRQKDKGWQYIISYKDTKGAWKQKSKQGFDTKKTAKKAAEERLEQLKKEVEAAIRVESQYRGITFGEFAKELLEHEKLYKAYNTIALRRHAVNRFEGIKHMPIADIKHMDVQKCVDKLIKDNLKISTVKDYLNSILYILNQAVAPYKIISSLPVEKIKFPAMQMETRNNEIQALNKKEISLLFAELKAHKDFRYYLLASVALATGLREGELLGLTWDNIDFIKSEIQINKQWKRLKKGQYGFGTLKRKSSMRVVPMSKSTKKMLLEYKELYNVVEFSNRVFPLATGDVINLMTRLSKKLGFTVTMHILRHTYATNLIANGVNFKTTAALLGHDVEMTMRTYSHVTDDMMQAAAKKINAIF